MDQTAKPAPEEKRTRSQSGAVLSAEQAQRLADAARAKGQRLRILTGDRTTGKLHIGHYVGSLRDRVRLQHSYDTFILLADVQALTTHYDRPEVLRQSVLDVALDYMAVGLIPYTGGADDGSRAKIVIQSMVPAIAELTVYYGLLVPMSLILDNPTTKAEAEQYGFSTTGSEAGPSASQLHEFDELTSSARAELLQDYPELGEVDGAGLLAALRELVAADSALLADELDYQSRQLEYHWLHRQWADYRQAVLEQYIMPAGLTQPQLELLQRLKAVIRPEAGAIARQHLPQELLALATELEWMRDILPVPWSPEVAERQTPATQPHMDEIRQLVAQLHNIMRSEMLRKELRQRIVTARRSSGLRQMNYGFLGYPVSQAADITFVGAHLVPVGEDQVPHIELTRDIVQRFNRQYGATLIEPAALVGSGGVVKGLDGSAKMSKSLDNAIYLSDDYNEIWRRISKAVTDPQRMRRTDPGRPEICNIFAYHQLFNEDTEPAIRAAGLNVPGVPETAELCRSAGIGCVDCKKNLAAKLDAMLSPMRERRADWAARPDDLRDVLLAGTRRGVEEGAKTLSAVKQAMQVDYF
jgi:tryptophanyl-tRNA synthetase